MSLVTNYPHCWHKIESLNDKCCYCAATSKQQNVEVQSSSHGDKVPVVYNKWQRTEISRESCIDRRSVFEKAYDRFIVFYWILGIVLMVYLFSKTYR